MIVFTRIHVIDDGFESRCIRKQWSYVLKEDFGFWEVGYLSNEGQGIAKFHDADSFIFLCPNGDLNPEALAGTSTSS